uniref:Uncharacterized protein n=1 Tax=Arundo donax TaxID=35708 RepID=A0A0A9AQD9_ARUDO
MGCVCVCGFLSLSCILQYFFHCALFWVHKPEV